MNYNHQPKHNSTVTLKVMCAIVFVMFSFTWLYFFQADLLAMTQHVLSSGMTSYKPLVGAVIITAILMVVQLVVYSVVRLKKRSYALTYGPSMLLLAILTNVNEGTDGGIGHMQPWWVILLIVLVWLLLVFVARVVQEVENDYSFSFFSRPVWINLLVMALLMMCVAGLSNTNAVFHYRMATEGCLARGDYEGALKVGRKSLESDADLLMLRMYALAREDALGERLFCYPVTGGVSQILPTNGRTRMLLCPVDSLYRFLGARPAREMEPMTYLSLVARRDSVVPKAVADYRLCGLLIDRQIDRFAEEVAAYYPLDGQLPRHYQEALTLYTHLRATPVVEFSQPVVEEDWNNLQELESRYPDRIERKGRVGEQYRNTYWYYYEYEK